MSAGHIFLDLRSLPSGVVLQLSNPLETIPGIMITANFFSSNSIEEMRVS